MDQRDFKAFQGVSIQTANPRRELAELPGTENWTEENVNIFEEEEGAMSVDDQIQVLRPSTHLRRPPAQHHLESGRAHGIRLPLTTACGAYGLMCLSTAPRGPPQPS